MSQVFNNQIIVIDDRGIHGQGFSLTHEEAKQEYVTMRLRYSAGILVRREVANKIRMFLDYQDISYDFNEYKSFLSSDYVIVIRGYLDKVAPVYQALQDWIERVEQLLGR